MRLFIQPILPLLLVFELLASSPSVGQELRVKYRMPTGCSDDAPGCDNDIDVHSALETRKALMKQRRDCLKEKEIDRHLGSAVHFIFASPPPKVNVNMTILACS
jgi:hypothetical protein